MESITGLVVFDIDPNLGSQFNPSEKQQKINFLKIVEICSIHGEYNNGSILQILFVSENLQRFCYRKTIFLNVTCNLRISRLDGGGGSL